MRLRSALLVLLACAFITEPQCFASPPIGRSDNQFRRAIAARDAEARAELLKSEIAYKKAFSSKELDKTGYLNSLVNYAHRLASSNRSDDGFALFVEGVDFYKSNSSSIPRGYQALLGYMDRRISVEDTEKYMMTLFEIAENERLQNTQDIDNLLTHRINDLYSRGIDFNHTKRLWLAVIGFRTKVRGKTDKALLPLYQAFASQCETHKELGLAEEYMFKQIALTQDDPFERAYRELWLAQFYFRSKMFEKSVAAAIRSTQIEGATANHFMAPSYVNLLTDYEEGYTTDSVEALIFSLLEHPSVFLLKNIDPKITALNNSYLRTGNFVKSEILLNKRIKASGQSMKDLACNDWRLKLSDLYLAMNRNADSQKLFKEVQESMALQGLSTASIIASRAELINKLKRANAR